MRRTLAGPGSSTSNHKATVDSGKSAPAGNTTGDSYRKTGSASGPQSSISSYTSTTDSGKQAPAGNTSDQFRRTGAASGPQSSVSTYTATLDPGVSSGVSGNGGTDYFSHHNDEQN